MKTKTHKVRLQGTSRLPIRHHRPCRNITIGNHIKRTMLTNDIEKKAGHQSNEKAVGKEYYIKGYMQYRNKWSNKRQEIKEMERNHHRNTKRSTYV